MTQEIVQATRVGNADICKSDLSDQSVMNSYCDANIINDYQRNTDCKNSQTHCYICCETEFGLVQYNNRMACYDKCDAKPVDHSEDPRGDWFWNDVTGGANSTNSTATSS